MLCKTLTDSPHYAELQRVRKYCITQSPGFAGVALLPSYFIIDPKDERFGKEYGFTDGRSIYLGTRLFEESPKAQAYVLLHEVLHVALRHPQRAIELRKARLSIGKNWSSTVFNWAVDAIVEHSLRQSSSWTHIPNCGLITFENLLKADVLKKRPAHKWGSESLFRYLMDEVVQPQIDNGTIKCAGDYGEGNLPQDGKGMLDIELGEQNGTIKPDTRGEKGDWEGRVKRAAAGDRAGGIMKEIMFDMPESKTPWQQHFRRFLTDAVMPTTHINPSRPSRYSIIMGAHHTAYRFSTNEVPFMPAFRPKPGVRNLVVVVDTSGSIDDRLCELFAGEIQGIRSKVGCNVTVITCDAEVHQIIEVKSHDNLHTVIKANGGFKGRGGTNFVPGVEAAEKVNGASVIVYLTDMQGPYPNKCKLPLLWASICEQYEKPPVGTVIVLKLDED